MSLIKCTECGKEVSDRANMCPNCGVPISEILKDYSKSYTVIVTKCTDEALIGGQISLISKLQNLSLKDAGSIRKNCPYEICKKISLQDAKKLTELEKRMGYETEIHEENGKFERDISLILEERLSRLDNRAKQKEIASKMEEVQEEVEENPIYMKNNTLNQMKCPNCGSYTVAKISTGKRVTSIAVWGLASSNIGKTYNCAKCGYKW